jgi:hypothetical protein
MRPTVTDLLTLKDLAADFAAALKNVDADGLAHKNYAPGVGPYGEREAVKAALSKLRKNKPLRYADAVLEYSDAAIISLRGNVRGSLDDTEIVLGLVIDADHDKGKGGSLIARPSLTIETSPGNFHHWYLLARPVSAAEAKAIGDAIRAATGADQATGVVTQCYRVPGTPNFLSKAKQARGRAAVEPTRIVEWNGRLWDPAELLAAHLRAAPPSTGQPRVANGVGVTEDGASLPDELMKSIREGGVGRGDDKSRSALFHAVVGALMRRRWDFETILDLLAKYPNGAAAKYAGRLREALKLSYDKITSAAGGGGGGEARPQRRARLLRPRGRRRARTCSRRSSCATGNCHAR